MVDHRRDLRVGVRIHEAATELMSFLDVDQIGIVFDLALPDREQFFEHDRDLHAVGRGQRIELDRVFTDGPILVVGGPCDRTIDVGKSTAALFVPGPDFRGDLAFFFGHGSSSLC